MSTVIEGVAPLPQLGVIRVEGPDAASFLQGQLTQDFALLDEKHARLAAHCSPKGRMLASFIGVRDGASAFLLIGSLDILPAALKRLSMYVLRAKAKLTDASAEFRLLGLAGLGAQAQQIQQGAPWARQDLGADKFIELYPADGVRRILWVAPASQPAPDGPALPPDEWDWLEVRSGVARITAPIVDAFVPQMLNYESVGGVNFKKGCYPGQEVVARSQFRGTLKRRAYIASAAVPLQAGQEVFHESDPSQPCGLVAQAAPAPGGGTGAIVSIQIAAAAGGQLTVGGPNGVPLALEPLPYLLLADV